MSRRRRAGLPSLAAGSKVTPHVLAPQLRYAHARGDRRHPQGRAVARSRQHCKHQHYLRADPTEKLAVLAAHGPPAIKPGRFRPPSDKLMAVLAAARNPSMPRH